MRRFFALAAAIVLEVSCSGTTDSEALTAKDFAVSFPIHPAAAGQVQRVDLPAAAIVAFKRADRGDMRVFDTRGRRLSIALLGNDNARLSQIHVQAIPFTTPTPTRTDPSVSIHVDRGGQAVSVDTAGNQGPAPDRAVLLDTRTIADPIVAIKLDAVVPVQNPVSIVVSSGTDLKNWQPIGEQVLFRPGDGPDLLGSGRIILPGQSLRGHYLRISWNGAPDIGASGATLFTSSSPLPPRLSINTVGLTLADTHHLQFSVPTQIAPAALRITMAGADGVLPLRLLGRQGPDQPWSPLAVGTLRQGEKGIKLQTGDSAIREFRLEADVRSAGFSVVPRLEVEFEPISVLVAFNGAAPYSLTVGNSAAAPAYFAVSDLTERRGPYAAAEVSGEKAVPLIITNASDNSRFSPRTVALWSALVLGAAILALAAYRLFRANPDNAQAQ